VNDGAEGVKMDSRLTFEELRLANVGRCEDAFDPVDAWNALEWGGAAAGELGEALNLIKKLRRGENIPIQDIAFELADAVIYIDLLAARLGIGLGEAIREKFNIVSERRGSKVRL
jgi:NTP pyrophosphatase (non-canonical NTP hydrolase)